jgi:hypothetical protein
MMMMATTMVHQEIASSGPVCQKSVVTMKTRRNLKRKNPRPSNKSLGKRRVSNVDNDEEEDHDAARSKKRPRGDDYDDLVDILRQDGQMQAQIDNSMRSLNRCRSDQPVTHTSIEPDGDRVIQAVRNLEMSKQSSRSDGKTGRSSTEKNSKKSKKKSM